MVLQKAKVVVKRASHPLVFSIRFQSSSEGAGINANDQVIASSNQSVSMPTASIGGYIVPSYNEYASRQNVVAIKEVSLDTDRGVLSIDSFDALLSNQARSALNAFVFANFSNATLELQIAVQGNPMGLGVVQFGFVPMTTPGEALNMGATAPSCLSMQPGCIYAPLNATSTFTMNLKLSTLLGGVVKISQLGLPQYTPGCLVANVVVPYTLGPDNTDSSPVVISIRSKLVGVEMSMPIISPTPGATAIPVSSSVRFQSEILGAMAGDVAGNLVSSLADTFLGGEQKDNDLPETSQYSVFVQQSSFPLFGPGLDLNVAPMAYQGNYPVMSCATFSDFVSTTILVGTFALSQEDKPGDTLYQLPIGLETQLNVGQKGSMGFTPPWASLGKFFEYYYFDAMEVTLVPVSNDFQRYMIIAGAVYGNTGDPDIEQVSNQSSTTLQSGDKSVTFSLPYVSPYSLLVTNSRGVDDETNDIDMTTVGQMYVKVLNSLVNNSMSPSSLEFMVFVSFKGLNFVTPKFNQEIQMCREPRWTEDEQGPIVSTMRFQSDGPAEIEAAGDMQPHMNTGGNEAKSNSAPNRCANDLNTSLLNNWRLRALISRTPTSPATLFPLVDSPGGLQLGSSIDFRSATTQARQLNLSVPPAMYQADPTYTGYSNVPAITHPGAALLGSIFRTWSCSTSWALRFESVDPASTVVIQITYDASAYTDGSTFKPPFGAVPTPVESYGSMSDAIIVARPGQWAQFHVPYMSPYPSLLTLTNPSQIGDRRRNNAIIRMWSGSGIAGTTVDTIANWTVVKDVNITRLELYARIGEAHGMGTPVTLPISMINGVLQRGKQGQTRELFYVPSVFRFLTGPGTGSLATYFSSLGQAQESIVKYVDSIEVTSSAEPYSASPTWWDTTQVPFFDVRASVLARTTVQAVLGVTIPANAVMVGDGTRKQVQITEKLYGLAAQIPVTLSSVSPTGGATNLSFGPEVFATPAASWTRDTTNTNYWYADKLTLNSRAYLSGPYLNTLPLVPPYAIIPISDMSASTHDIPLVGKTWAAVPGSYPPLEISDVLAYPGAKVQVTGFLKGSHLLQKTEVKERWELDDCETESKVSSVRFQSECDFSHLLTPVDVVSQVRFQSGSGDDYKHEIPCPGFLLCSGCSDSECDANDGDDDDDDDGDDEAKPPPLGFLGPELASLASTVTQTIVEGAYVISATGSRIVGEFQEFWQNPKLYLEEMCGRIVLKLTGFVATTVTAVAQSTFSELWDMLRDSLKKIPMYLVVSAVLMIVSELVVRVKIVRDFSSWILQGLLQLVDGLTDTTAFINKKLIEAIKSTKEAFLKFGQKFGKSGSNDVEDPATATELKTALEQAGKIIEEDKTVVEDSDVEPFGSKLKHWAMVLVSFFTMPQVSTVVKSLKTAVAAITIVNIMERTITSFSKMFEKFSGIFPVYYTFLLSYFATDIPPELQSMQHQLAFVQRMCAIHPTSKAAITAAPKFNLYRAQLVQFGMQRKFQWSASAKEYYTNTMQRVDAFHAKLPKGTCRTSGVRKKPVSIGFYGEPGIGKDVTLTALVSQFVSPDEVANINISNDNRVESIEYSGQAHLRLGEIFNIKCPEADKQVISFFQRLVDNIPFCADSAFDKGEVWLHPHYVWWSTNINLAKTITAVVSPESWMRRSLHILCVLKASCKTNGKVDKNKTAALKLREGEQLDYYVMMTNPSVGTSGKNRKAKWQTGQLSYTLQPGVANSRVVVGEEINGLGGSEWCEGYHGVTMKRKMNYSELVETIKRCSTANAQQLNTLTQIAHASASSYSVFTRDMASISQSTITRSVVAKGLAKAGNKWLEEKGLEPDQWRECFVVSSQPRNQNSCPFSNTDGADRDERSMFSRIDSVARDYSFKAGNDYLEPFLLQLEDGYIGFLGKCLVDNTFEHQQDDDLELKHATEDIAQRLEVKPVVCLKTLGNLLNSPKLLNKYFPGTEGFHLEVAPGSEDYFYFRRNGTKVAPDATQLALKEKIISFVVTLSDVDQVQLLPSKRRVEVAAQEDPDIPDAMTEAYWSGKRAWGWVQSLYSSTANLGDQMLENPTMTVLAAFCVFRTFSNLNKVTQSARNLVASGVPTEIFQPLTPGLRPGEEYSVKNSHVHDGDLIVYSFDMETEDDCGSVEKVDLEKLLDEFLEFSQLSNDPSRALTTAKSFLDEFCSKRDLDEKMVKDCFAICKVKYDGFEATTHVLRESSSFRQKMLANVSGIFCNGNFLVTFLAETLRTWSKEDVTKRAELLTTMLDENDESIQVSAIHFESGTGGRGRRGAPKRRVKVHVPVPHTTRFQSQPLSPQVISNDDDVWKLTGWRPLEANKVRLKSIEDRIGELTTTVFGEVQRLGGFDMGRGFIATNAHGLYPRSGLAPENAVGQVNPIASKSLIRFKAGDGVYTTMAISSSQVQLVRSVSHDLKVDLAMIYKGPGPTIKSAGSIFLKQDEINSMTSFSNVIFLTPKKERRYIGTVIVEPESSVVGAFGRAPFRHCGILRYRSPRNACDGCCGGVYVAMFRGNVYVLGFHASTSDYKEQNSLNKVSSYATAILVCRETLLSIGPPPSDVYDWNDVNFPERKLPKLCDFDQSSGTFIDRSPMADEPSDEKVCPLADVPSFKQYYKSPPSAQYIGCVDEKVAPNKSKTALEASPSQHLTESNYKPSFQGDEEVTSDTLKGLGLLRSRTKYRESMSLKDYSHAITYMIDEARNKPPSNPLKFMLTPEEGINGSFVDMEIRPGHYPKTTTLSNEGKLIGDPDYVSGTIPIKGLDSSASAGWGSSGKKTRDFLTSETRIVDGMEVQVKVIDLSTEYGRQADALLKKVIETLLKGECVWISFAVALKDEALETSTVKEWLKDIFPGYTVLPKGGKTRIISIVAWVINLALKMFLGPMITYFKVLGTGVSWVTSKNLYSPWIDQFAESMSHVTKSSDAQFVGGDVINQEGEVDQVTTQALCMLKSKFDDLQRTWAASEFACVKNSVAWSFRRLNSFELKDEVAQKRQASLCLISSLLPSINKIGNKLFLMETRNPSGSWVTSFLAYFFGLAMDRKTCHDMSNLMLSLLNEKACVVKSLQTLGASLVQDGEDLAMSFAEDPVIGPCGETEKQPTHKAYTDKLYSAFSSLVQDSLDFNDHWVAMFSGDDVIGAATSELATTMAVFNVVLARTRAEKFAKRNQLPTPEYVQMEIFKLDTCTPKERLDNLRAHAGSLYAAVCKFGTGVILNDPSGGPLRFCSEEEVTFLGNTFQTNKDLSDMLASKGCLVKTFAVLEEKRLVKSSEWVRPHDDMNAAWVRNLNQILELSFTAGKEIFEQRRTRYLAQMDQLGIFGQLVTFESCAIRFIRHDYCLGDESNNFT